MTMAFFCLLICKVKRVKKKWEGKKKPSKLNELEQHDVNTNRHCSLQLSLLNRLSLQHQMRCRGRSDSTWNEPQHRSQLDYVSCPLDAFILARIMCWWLHYRRVKKRHRQRNRLFARNARSLMRNRKRQLLKCWEQSLLHYFALTRDQIRSQEGFGFVIWLKKNAGRREHWDPEKFQRLKIRNRNSSCACGDKLIDEEGIE